MFDVEKNEYRISNKEPQNDEGFTSKFDILCSIFCGWLLAISKNVNGGKLKAPRILNLNARTLNRSESVN